jgi:hypothetical protein
LLAAGGRDEQAVHHHGYGGRHGKSIPIHYCSGYNPARGAKVRFKKY